MLRKSLKASSHVQNVNPPVIEECLQYEIEDKTEEETVLEEIVIGNNKSFIDQICEPLKKKPKTTDTFRKPAWDDEDDNNSGNFVKVDINLKKNLVKSNDSIPPEKFKESLKKRFERVTGTPDWAQLDRDKFESDDSDDENLLQSTRNYLTGSLSLPRNVIQMKKCIDLNKDNPSHGKLKSVEFHPTAQVALCAGKNQTLNLFQVDGKINAKIQSLFIDKFPIFNAHFTPDGENVIMGSIHKSFYNYDMIAGKMINIPQIKGINEHNMCHFKITPDGKYIVFMGKYGHMHLISLKTKEWISTLKMNGSVDDICFNSGSTQMFSFGDDGDVYCWDLRTLSCLYKFVDDGCIQGKALACSPNDKYLATGSYSGVVNIYESTELVNKRPLPLKAIMNLTTPCTDLKFNSSSEILAMASNYCERGVKLMHIPSMTIFSNFPDKSDSIRIPMCMDFSLNSGYFAVGNHTGNALLYRVKHFGNY